MAAGDARRHAGDVLVVFSDLDGTLLDPESYDWRQARAALEVLRERGVPLVLASSKTRAELEFWRARLGNRDPYIVENGGALVVPRGYFPFRLPGAIEREEGQIVELGRPYRELTQALEEAAAESGVRVLGFRRMTAEQVRRCTGLPPAQARLARQRDYDEAFQILSSTPPEPLLRAIERRGLRWTRGGRFYHILGDNDKAAAAGILLGAYRRVHGRVHSVGLGDGWNDVGLLRLVDTPVLIRTPVAPDIQAVLSRARITRRPGPEGWKEAILEILRRPAASEVVP